MKRHSALPAVLVRSIDEKHLPLGIPRTGFGCFDHDSPCGSNVHVWIVPGQSAGQRQCFSAVSRNGLADELPHHGTVNDLRGVVLMEEASESVVFHPSSLWYCIRGRRVRRTSPGQHRIGFRPKRRD